MMGKDDVENEVTHGGQGENGVTATVEDKGEKEERDEHLRALL